MKEIKWNRQSSHQIATKFNGKIAVIGKDRGSMDRHTFYYLEIENKVVQHGFGTQKAAKEFFIEKFVKPSISNAEKFIEDIKGE